MDTLFEIAADCPGCARMSGDNHAFFDRLEDIGPDAVEWLKAGSEQRGRYIHNDRAIFYSTKNGTRKGIVYHKGARHPWRTWTARGTRDRLTNEEARIFAPEIAWAREELKRDHAARIADKRERLGTVPVKVGDVFGGSYGYDATIWHFYEVVKVSESGKTIWTREVAQEGEYDGPCSWLCRPVPGRYMKEAEKHAVKWETWRNDGPARPYFKANEVMNAYLLDDVEKWRHGDNYH